MMRIKPAGPVGPLGSIKLFGLLSALFFIGLLGLISAISPARENSRRIIEITNAGFNPISTTISLDETVVFVNKAGGSAQPASDPHPSHAYLAGFDPKRALAPGESWSFTFRKSGTWKYHDHLNVSRTGEVVVKSGDGNEAGSFDCGAVPAEDRNRCIQGIVEKTVSDEGIEAAFAELTAWYEKGEVPECHWTAHAIGKAAAQLFLKGSRFPLSRATVFCTYGFYHGFLEYAIRDTNDPKIAIALCDEAGAQLGYAGRDGCLHGIGHGFMEDPPPESYWGKPARMALRPLSVCESFFASNRQELDTCATGAYSAVLDFMIRKRYGLSFDAASPLKFCAGEPYTYQKPCYSTFAPELWRAMQERKIRALLPYIATIPADIRAGALQGAVGYLFQEKSQAGRLSEHAADCRAFGGALAEACVLGIVHGLASYNPESVQRDIIMGFCRNNAATDAERDFCLDAGYSALARTQSKGTMATICRDAEEPYRSRWYCR